MIVLQFQYGKLPASIPIETGLQKQWEWMVLVVNSSIVAYIVSHTLISHRRYICTNGPPKGSATIAICYGPKDQSNRLGRIHGSFFGGCQS